LVSARQFSLGEYTSDAFFLPLLLQLGVQHTEDAILKRINRGCTTAQVIYIV